MMRDLNKLTRALLLQLEVLKALILAQTFPKRLAMLSSIPSSNYA